MSFRKWDQKIRDNWETQVGGWVEKKNIVKDTSQFHYAEHCINDNTLKYLQNMDDMTNNLF